MVMRIAMRERRDAQAKGLSESADDRRVMANQPSQARADWPITLQTLTALQVKAIGTPPRRAARQLLGRHGGCALRLGPDAYVSLDKSGI